MPRGPKECGRFCKATVAKETIDRLLVNGHLSMDEGVVRVK